MFTESSQLLHPTHPVLSKANLYPACLEDGKNFACMLVIPGGGYGMVSHQEGPPVAGWLNSLGISAVTLEYSVGEGVYPEPQQQALYAMRWLKKEANNLNIDPERIGVIGFSAGGHLAACIAEGFDREEWLIDPDQNLDGLSARPKAAILSYPVISSGEFSHRGSFENLLGASSSKEEQQHLSWEHHVHQNSPPVFLWHTAEDDVVPPENSYLMAMGLSRASIPHELHVFPQGEHGVGLGSIGHRRQGSLVQWKACAERWLMDLGF